jgi:hypothetical protein
MAKNSKIRLCRICPQAALCIVRPFSRAFGLRGSDFPELLRITDDEIIFRCCPPRVAHLSEHRYVKTSVGYTASVGYTLRARRPPEVSG